MTEWGVVGVLVTIVTFVLALIKPVSALTKSITELATVVSGLRKDMDEHKANSRESHTKLWQHNDEQDKRLAEHGEALASHESRIRTLEGDEWQHARM